MSCVTASRMTVPQRIAAQIRTGCQSMHVRIWSWVAATRLRLRTSAKSVRDMRARTLAALFGVTFAVACLVDRPSEDLTCSTTADCGRFPELRACIDHYCVVQDCPDDCTACDESAKTCQVDCSSADDCSG